MKPRNWRSGSKSLPVWLLRVTLGILCSNTSARFCDPWRAMSAAVRPSTLAGMSEALASGAASGVRATTTTSPTTALPPADVPCC